MILFRHPLPPALICALLWGSAFPVIKFVYGHWEQQGLAQSLSLILLFAGVRFIMAGAGLLAIRRNVRQELHHSNLRLVLLFALTQTFIQYVFFYQSVAVSSGSLTALLVATGSFWWMLFAPLMLKPPWPSTTQWIGLLLGGLGVTIAVHSPGAGAGNPVLGALFMLTATASGALAMIIFQGLNSSMSAINATGLSLLLGGLGLTAVGAPSLPELPQIFSGPVALATLWLAFVSAAAFSLWNYLSTLYPVTLLSSYRFLIPLCGVVEALLFIPGESAGWGLFVGAPLVLLSMMMAKRSAQ